MTMRKKQLNALITTALTGLFCANAHAANLGDTEVNFGGYIKVDAMWSDFSAGTLSGNSAGRDFYIPSTVPVGDDADNDVVFDMHARQSRFNFATATKLDNGKTIKGKLELDFIASVGGNERVSNSHSPRIRHAFISYDGWLLGQTWSNFQNVSALPEVASFLGPSEGTVFVRQVQARYTTGNWSFSAENPESTVTVNGARVETDDASLPDFTARYTHKADWGHIAVAGLARQLSYDKGGVNADETSFGLSVSGKVNVGSHKDNLKFMLTQGKGLGRYVALNLAHGGVLNGNDIDAIDSTSGFVAYQHYWNSQLRSTAIYSFFSADNNADLLALTGDPTEKSSSYSVNLMYSPVKKLTLGAEIKRANREVYSGKDGDLTRLQFSAKYSF